MTRARQHLISLQDTPYYHVMSRCVRRAYLCGHDPLTGRNYEHRKKWLEQRIRLLSSIFAIDLCSFAIMSNHYHIVVKIEPKQAALWSSEEVLRRWSRLHKGTLLAQKYLKRQFLTPSEQETLAQTEGVYRDRLTSLSWFMKCLNEPIARKANAEDECSGHFWEARFTSQALLTDKALLACMVYVDLNPVRANQAETPEQSLHTSIRERLRPSLDLEKAIREQLNDSDHDSTTKIRLKPLVPFRVSGDRLLADTPSPLPISMKHYLELLDVTGRLVRQDKRGAISSDQPRILKRLAISVSDWKRYSMNFERSHQLGEFRLGSCSSSEFSCTSLLK